VATGICEFEPAICAGGHVDLGEVAVDHVDTNERGTAPAMKRSPKNFALLVADRSQRNPCAVTDANS
jgi:hypothetical protein